MIDSSGNCVYVEYYRSINYVIINVNMKDSLYLNVNNVFKCK